MKRAKKSLQFCIFMVCVFLFATSVFAGDQKVVNVLPDVTFKGELKTFRGHELGYLRPQEGDAFELDFTHLEQIKDAYRFENKRYIPIPASPKVQGVDGEPSFEKWNNFRAVSGINGYTVTLDAQRKPGFGDKDYVVIWIMIESGERISGFAEIHGKIYKKGQ